MQSSKPIGGIYPSGTVICCQLRSPHCGSCRSTSSLVVACGWLVDDRPRRRRESSASPTLIHSTSLSPHTVLVLASDIILVLASRSPAAQSPSQSVDSPSAPTPTLQTIQPHTPSRPGATTAARGVRAPRRSAAAPSLCPGPRRLDDRLECPTNPSSRGSSMVSARAARRRRGEVGVGGERGRWRSRGCVSLCVSGRARGSCGQRRWGEMRGCEGRSGPGRGGVRVRVARRESSSSKAQNRTIAARV